MMFADQPFFGHFHDPYAYGQRAPRPRRQQPARPLASRTLEPLIDTRCLDDGYTLTLSAPHGFRLVEPHASIDGRDLMLQGHIAMRQMTNTHEYVARSRAVVYEHPRPGTRPIAVLPRGSIVQGSAPSSSGWIKTADGDFMLDDGSLQLISVARPPAPVPFDKAFELPLDANLDAATSEMTKDGSLHISVPKIRRGRPASSRMCMPQAAQDFNLQPPANARSAERVSTPKQASEKSRQPHNVQVRTVERAHDAQPPKPRPESANVSEPRSSTSSQTAASRPTSAPAPKKASPRDNLPTKHLQKAEPILQESTVRAENVQRPIESMEEWVADESGGFVRIR